MQTRRMGGLLHDALFHLSSGRFVILVSSVGLALVGLPQLGQLNIQLPSSKTE